MKNLRAVLFSFLILLSFPYAHASFLFDDEFPEEREYKPLKDSGFSKYTAHPLYQTNQIVLTFDDGPSPALTPLVLDILRKYNVKATFFMVGRNINSATFPIIERALREGHKIGAHSMHHTSSNALNESQFVSDTRETFKRIQGVLDQMGFVQNEVYYRYPYGAYGRNAHYNQMNNIRELGKKIWGDNCINFAFWTVDSSDWIKGMTGNEVYQNIMANFDGGIITGFEKVNGHYQKVKRQAYKFEITHGGVVLFHDVHTPSIEALPHLLETFENRGIKVVPINTVNEYAFGSKVCGSNPNKNF